MSWSGAIAAVVLIVLILMDAFEVMILPRRVRRGLRLAPLFYRTSWILWRTAAALLPAGRYRNGWLSAFGPLSLLALLAVWAIGLIVGFGLLQWSLGTPIKPAETSFAAYLYFSGTTFLTLGYGDLVTASTVGRALSVAEAGIGFGFLAVTISYLPVLYQAFSRREITISLLDARAGSPPTAGELLRRLATHRGMADVGSLLAEWERWAAELLESHLSYPVLSYYRSQHENQSWVATLTAILDTSSLLITTVDGPDGYQARLTFAMARHAAVDLAMVFQTPPCPPSLDRLPEPERDRLWTSLREAELVVREAPKTGKTLSELRELYEPFVNALADYFLLTLPPFQPQKPPVDNWQTSAWTRRSPGLGGLSTIDRDEDHFD
jgi:hypothetical protein